ncbi:hypothetical protein [Paenibacillus validus]|uniref:hypothetical protein n=1 Tax=Paenibacillus validus TaxID=44253 RepID=UPI003D2C8AC1
MVVKKGLPENLTVLLQQLVQQKQIRTAGTVLFIYLRRNWQFEEEDAAFYMIRYFKKYYPSQLERHHKKV